MIGKRLVIGDAELSRDSLVTDHTLKSKLLAVLLVLVILAAGGCHRPTETGLFDGKSLGKWKITDFGGQGRVHVKDGVIFLEMGNDMTGVTWTGPVMRMNYEIELDAMRVQGSDIFCGLTFPVDANCCSLVLGGWGGQVCGISSLNYYDASENETTRIIEFQTGRWYHVRVRVAAGKIEAWLDDEKIVDVETAGKHIDTRIEMDLSKPLGIATWRTTGAVRNIRMVPFRP
jgi:hypothetical protein